MDKITFIAPNGKLYQEGRFFIKASLQIEGVSITELWCDAYQANLDMGNQVLFPADFNCPFSVTEHKYEKEAEFIEKGGGFRLNLYFDYRLYYG